MFYKKTIKNLRDNIANLERKIDNYERKEELLIKYAENIGSKRIFGGLLISDDMEYLYKFYSKNGFNVKRTSFEKILNDNANIE